MPLSINKHITVAELSAWYNPDICDECEKLKQLPTEFEHQKVRGKIMLRRAFYVSYCQQAESGEPCIVTGVIYIGEEKENGS